MGVFNQITWSSDGGDPAPDTTVQPRPGALEPIAGVDIDTYAAIVRSIAPHGYDQSLLPGIAAARGIAPAAWQAAHEGWNARIESDPLVARAFSSVYRST